MSECGCGCGCGFGCGCEYECEFESEMHDAHTAFKEVSVSRIRWVLSARRSQNQDSGGLLFGICHGRLFCYTQESRATEAGGAAPAAAAASAAEATGQAVEGKCGGWRAEENEPPNEIVEPVRVE